LHDYFVLAGKTSVYASTNYVKDFTHEPLFHGVALGYVVLVAVLISHVHPKFNTVGRYYFIKSAPMFSIGELWHSPTPVHCEYSPLANGITS
jgi:hypothetical protein